MTFFLNGGEDPQPIKPAVPDRAPTEYLTGLGASFSKLRQTQFQAAQQKSQAMALTAEQAARRLGLEKLKPILLEYNTSFAEMGMPRNITALPETSAGFAEMFGPFSSEAILDLAAKDAAENPDLWKDLEVSKDAIEAGVTQQRAAERAEANAIIEMMPDGQTSAGLIGGIGAALTDPTQIPFFLLGGGTGSLLKILGREAFLGAASEVVTLPDQYATAKEFDEPNPDPIKQAVIGALAGVVLGGAIEAPSAINRGLEYYRARSTAPVIDGVDPATAGAAVDAAESALQAGDSPLEAVAQMMRAKAPDEAPIAPLEPLIPKDKVPGPVVGGVDPIETLPIRNADQPMETATIQKMADAAIKDADDSRMAKPLIQWLRKSGKPTKAQIAKAEKEGRPVPTEGVSNQIHPDGPLAAELKAQDITPRSFPGMFSRNGRKDFDNLVASEMEADFPGIIDATRTQYGADYLDRQGFLDVIIRDARGDGSWLRSRADAQAIQRAADDAIEGRTSVDDFVSGAKADDGFFVDLNKYQFDGTDGKEAIAADFDAYTTSKGFNLLPRERDEILNELQTRGGDGEYLVERALEREIDDVDRLYPEPNDGTDPLAASGGAQAGDLGPRAEDFGPEELDPAGSRADYAGDAEPFGFERTSAGQQAVIPGVAPIGTRERLEAAQRAPMGQGGPDSYLTKPQEWNGFKQIVDADGKPKVFYHGSISKVDDNFSFSESMIGSANDPGAYGVGFYLTEDIDLARHYAYSAKDPRPENVLAAHVFMNKPFLYNPFDYDGTQSRLRAVGFEIEGDIAQVPASRVVEFTAKLKKAGFDGVLVAANRAGNTIAETVVFSNKQVRQITSIRQTDSQIGGLFDPGYKVRTDLFDSPLSPKAKQFDDARVNELRTALEDGDDLDVGILSDDGRELSRMSDVLAEIDELDAMSREIELCRTGKVSE